jgi:hypothetical protein
MTPEGHRIITESVTPLGGEVYPVPGEGQDIADLEIRFPIKKSGDFHPSDAVAALRNDQLLADGYGTNKDELPKLCLKGMLAGAVWYAFSDRGSRPDVMLFEDTNVTESQ